MGALCTTFLISQHPLWFFDPPLPVQSATHVCYAHGALFCIEGTTTTPRTPLLGSQIPKVVHRKRQWLIGNF